MQSACSTLYGHPCPVRPYHILFTLSHKRQDFRGKKVKEHKTCLIVPTPFVRNIFHSKKNWARYCHKCAYVFRYSTGQARQILINLNFLDRLSKRLKYQITCRVVPCGRTDRQTDRQTEMTKLIVTFHNFSKRQKIKTSYIISTEMP